RVRLAGRACSGLDPGLLRCGHDGHLIGRPPRELLGIPVAIPEGRICRGLPALSTLRAPTSTPTPTRSRDPGEDADRDVGVGLGNRLEEGDERLDILVHRIGAGEELNDGPY